MRGGRLCPDDARGNEVIASYKQKEGLFEVNAAPDAKIKSLKIFM